MQVTFNTGNPSEVAEVKALLRLDNKAETAAPTYLPEDKPEVVTPAPAAAAAPVETPAAAPAAAPVITLDVIKAKVNEINLTDQSKLADVKEALNAIGVDKTSNLQPEQFEDFFNRIKDLI